MESGPVFPSCALTTLLEPKPISASRQLKVKNSISHLMKALPALPGLTGLSLTSSSAVSDNGDFVEVLKPFELTSTETLNVQSNGLKKQLPTRPVRENEVLPQHSPPKLRLKMTLAPEKSTQDKLPTQVSIGGLSSVGQRPPRKLKVRTSRSSRATDSQDDINKETVQPSDVAKSPQLRHEKQMSKPKVVESSTIIHMPGMTSPQSVSQERLIPNTTDGNADGQKRTTVRVKNRMSSVLRWLDETDAHECIDFLEATGKSYTEQSLATKSTGSKVPDFDNDLLPPGVSHTKRKHRSLRKLVRAKITKLVKEAKSVVRKGSKSRGMAT